MPYFKDELHCNSKSPPIFPLWTSYTGVHKMVCYEGGLSISLSALISLQPLGLGHATIPHIKALDVPFHLIYGSLICAKRFQSDRQNKEGCSQTPGGHQYMIIKYLSVGQWTWFLYQQVALNVLFQMRYESIPNSTKQPIDSLKAEATPVFTTYQDCFAYCFAQWGPSGVCRHASSFSSITLQALGVQ